MEIDVQTTRQSVRPLHGLWKAGEAPRAAKPAMCAKTREHSRAKRRPRPSRAKTMARRAGSPSS
jgi:hypothetical protein